MSNKKLVVGVISVVFACLFFVNLPAEAQVSTAGYDFQAAFSGKGKSVNGALNMASENMDAYANNLNPPPTHMEMVGKPQVRMKMKNFKVYYHARIRVRFVHTPQ